MMKQLVTSVVVAFAFGVCGAEKNDWENPEVNSINRLPSRTYSMPLADEKDSFTDALEPETPYAVSLNGDWKYSWTGNPDLRIKDFWRIDYDDSRWFTIDVPSCVEMRGFGSPGYTNQKYPHADLSHPTNAAFASIRDRMSGKADYNPVSSYRRAFMVPESWKGRRIILRFDGVMSAYYVWVNGRRVGYAEDSFLPSEFDVTGFVRDGENVLAVEVYRWSDGSYLEDQDMTRFSGIFRDVTLWSMPKEGIWDFAVKTVPLGGYEKWNLEVKVEDEVKVKGEGEERTLVSLYDADGKKVCDLHSSPSPLTFASTLAARAWSAEKPYLYTLVIRKGSDIRMKRVGFKEQKVVGNLLLVNGEKVKFKGVNRHESNPENGRTVSLEDMVRDITLMKRYNINMVRTAHYPDHHLWYDLCDRYGIFLCAEANIEGHEPQYGEKGLGRFPEWNRTIVERNVRHVRTYRNHPSVTMWSLGNETGHGVCFSNAAVEVRRLDPSRVLHWERGNRIADVDAGMYAGVKWLEARGRYSEGLCTLEDVAKESAYDYNQSGGKPFFMSEFAHAMGNSLGNYREYWDIYYRYDALCGGCVWDWIDQAVWKLGDRKDPRTGRVERYLAYGGDFDEQPNDGPFDCNGIIGPERKVSSKLVEVGHVHRNLVVERKAEGSLELWNRFDFTFADEFDGMWELLADGVVVNRGALAVPHLAPHARCDISSLVPHSSSSNCETFLNVEFRLKDDCAWAAKGWPVSRNQVCLNERRRDTFAISTGKDVRLEAGDQTITVICGNTRAVFDRETGTLSRMEMEGRTILDDALVGGVSGPRLTCERAPTDNDRWLYGNPAKMDEAGTFTCFGLTQLRYHVRPIEIVSNGVRIVTEVTGSKSAGFTHEAIWRFEQDGSIDVENVVAPHGTMPPALPRLGLSLKLAGALERMRYYGRGPHENYIDRNGSSFVGIYDSTVSDQFEEYVRPQDNGYKCDVRWVAFMDESGRGVRFAASQPLFVQALHFGLEDLRLARPQRGQPRFRVPLTPREEVCLNLDIRQTGIGNASCGGHAPLPQYRFPIGQERWTLHIEPLAR